MKRIIYLLTAFLLSSSLAWGQAGRTAQGITYMGGRQKAASADKQVQHSVSGGQIMLTPHKTVSNLGPNPIMSGFPYGVSYFPIVFNNIFASKGYFADYVQLRWQIVGSEDKIKQFHIWRKKLGSSKDSVLVTSLPKDSRSFRDDTAPLGEIQEYTIYAEGIADGLNLPRINIIRNLVGFSYPTGTASGKVSFKGGNAVQGVTILAEPERKVGGEHSLFLDTQSFLRINHEGDNDLLGLEEGFSVQMWVKTAGGGALFSKGNQYKLSYHGGMLQFSVGGREVSLPFRASLDTFFHVTATYEKGKKLKLYAQMRTGAAAKLDSAVTDAPVNMPKDNSPIDLGSAALSAHIDEVRLWKKALDSTEIVRDFSRYLTGKEQHLVGYWRMNEGVGSAAYDFSAGNAGFHEHHAYFVSNPTWSTIIPLKSQLSYKGITDQDGLYMISGFPYPATGMRYRFTPVLGVHEFDPSRQARFVTGGNNNFENVDFTDISSFKVTGTVYYSGTYFPTQGVEILVDNVNAIKNGRPVMTDKQGKFEVEVPIGKHSIRLKKHNHTFVQGGVFPAITEKDSSGLYDFQEPLVGIEFFDNTRVKVVGRLVGGTREGDKPLGFGLSVNNIGNASLQLTTEKGWDLTKKDTVETYEGERHFTAKATYTALNPKDLQLEADTESGEYVAYLLPEVYLIKSAKAGNYNFDKSYTGKLDLRSFTAEKSLLEQAVYAEVGGKAVAGYPPLDPKKYKRTYTKNSGDTLYTIGLDTMHFDVRKDFVLRNPPSIDVVNAQKKPYLGEKKYKYSDDKVKNKEIPLVDEDGKYLFGYPVFSQGSEYVLKVSVFESYVNADKGNAEDRVPVTDGTIEIQNDFAGKKKGDNAKASLSLNKKGETLYKFKAGAPNMNKDIAKPELSYTLPISVQSITGKVKAIRTIWRKKNPLRAYVWGKKKSGSNFTTRGPNKIINILRDPPGTNSYTYLEKGSTFTKTDAWSFVNSGHSEQGAQIKKGVKLKILVAMTKIKEIKLENTLDIGMTSGGSRGKSGETIDTYTTTERFSTGSSPPYIGDLGDVYIGTGTNIVFGVSKALQFLPANSKECELGNCSGKEVNGFKLGIRPTLAFGTENTTSFMYSQLQLESVVIPELKRLRNRTLKYYPEGYDSAKLVETIEEPLYISLVAPSDTTYFGTSNNNKKVWGDKISAKIGEGPSYVIILPKSYYDDKGDLINELTNDKIFNYNNDIAEWENTIRKNEKAKVEATKGNAYGNKESKFDKENISIDGGTTYESSFATTNDRTNTATNTWTLGAKTAAECGFTVSGVGVVLKASVEYKHDSEETSSTTNSNSTTYGFVLADGEGANVVDGTFNDYFSVDVMNARDGYSPVFYLRGGATSCPHEGVRYTKYYEKEKYKLSAGTAKIEDPDLTIETPVVSGVPSGGKAEIYITLKNDSEVAAGNSVRMGLTVDGKTNPNGLQVSMDGAALGEGLVPTIVPGGEGVRKLLIIEQSKADITDYEDIVLRMRSTCDPETFVDKTFSVYFQPSCANVKLLAPANKWVMNTNKVPELAKDANAPVIMPVTFGEYNLKNKDLDHAVLQYKGSTSSQWISVRNFYNPNKYTQAAFDKLKDTNKDWLSDSGKTTYKWEMSSLPDRNYDLRIVMVCKGSETTETVSHVHSGVKDMKRPALFGAPQPADGVLSANDKIEVVFDELIDKTSINLSNIRVQGVLNGYELRHDASLSFDGSTNYVRIPEGLDMSKTPFTIEWWQQRAKGSGGKRQVVFSKGLEAGNKIEIGFTEADKLFVRIGEQEITSLLSYTSDEWQHFAVVYTPSNQELNVYMNDERAIERAPVSGKFSGEGAIMLGKSVITGDQHFKGNIHELRIWDKARTLGDVFAQMLKAQKGTEIGLIGYWPFDEAFGNTGLDKARFRHASLFTSWLVLPKGVGYAFDGKDDYLELSTGNTVIINSEMDFSLEFWFKAAEGQKDVTLFSSGKADGSDKFNQGNWRVGFNTEGQLAILGNGKEITLQGAENNFLNDNWHHFALSVNRRGNVQVYINGDLRAQANSAKFGGLTGNKMWLGARGFKEGTITTKHDQFFKGKIDEVRIWNLNRKKEQILLYRNAKVSNKEPGLVAYYPFEQFEVRQGVTFTEPTLADQWKNPYGKNGGKMTAFGGADFSPETPNLKQSRPVSKVDFSWALFENKLLITPSASMFAAIEQRILEITVERIEDLYDNRIASPITWTAFVDRNQLKWSKRSVSIEKRLNEKHSFTVDILNKSGQQQQFSFSNLPAWLTAKPASGTIEPQNAQTVTFTINEGLNTGSYQQDLYLVGNSGFDEKMVLNVRVFNKLPDNWVVDKDKFAHSMNVVGLLKINGKISTDTHDILGAFVEEECRGFVRLEYIQQIDSYLAFLTVYSNKVGNEQLTFRIWDDSEGIIFTDVEPALQFAQNQTHGRVLKPVEFSAVGALQTEVHIPAGWKWISFSLKSKSLGDMNKLFKRVNNNKGDLIKGFDKYAVYDDLAKWQGSLQDGGIRNEQSYKVNFGKPAILRYSGAVLDLRNTPIKVAKGWNWISYLPQQNLTVDEALASFAAQSGDVLKSQSQFAEYVKNIGWLGSLKFMRPGDGYMLFSQGEKEKSIVYPTLSLLNGRLAAPDEETLEAGDYHINPSDYAHNMSMVAQVEEGLGDGTLLAFLGKECRGIAKPMRLENGQVRYFLTLFGNDGDMEETTPPMLTFRYLSAEGLSELSAEDVLVFRNNGLAGNLDNPVQLRLNTQTQSSPQAWDAYPNPFSQSVEIAFHISAQQQGQMSEVSVYNVSGQRIRTLHLGTLDAGRQRLSWDGNGKNGKSVAAGMYFIRIQTGEKSKMLKVIKR